VNKKRKDKFLLILFSESMRVNKDGTVDLKNVTDFVRLQAFEFRESKDIKHGIHYNLQVDQEFRSEIDALYWPFNLKLKELLGDDLDIGCCFV